MKLIYCPVCDDVFRLIDTEWRICQCGRSGGQYTPDSETACIGGIGKVFGIPNPFFSEAYMAPPQIIKGLREKYNNLWSTEVWWGEYKGDWQLIRVSNPMGPVPRNWEKQIRKLKEAGGVKGYNRAKENRLREKYRARAFWKWWYHDLSGRIWKKYLGKRDKHVEAIS